MIVIFAAHEATQGTQRAVSDQREVVEFACGQREAAKALALFAQLGFVRRSDGPVDEFAAVGSDHDTAFNSMHVAESLELGENLGDALVDGLALAIHDDVGILRRFVRIGDAGEVLHFAGDGLFVKAFDVAAHELVQGTAHVDFDETIVSDPLTRLGARLRVRRDCGRDDRGVVPHQERGDERDTSDIDVAILAAESESF